VESLQTVLVRPLRGKPTVDRRERNSYIYFEDAKIQVLAVKTSAEKACVYEFIKICLGQAKWFTTVFKFVALMGKE
jgi:hypothetical protein